MRLILINETKEGMVLGKSLYDEKSRLLLSAGYRLTSEIIRKLASKGHNYIYIIEKGTETVIPEDIISDEISIQAKSKLNNKSDEVQRALILRDLNMEKFSTLLKSGYLRRVNITSDLLQVVNEILVDISIAGAKFIGTMLLKTENYYNMDHAVNCTILAILLGKQFNFNNKELKILALGTYLHDFGKIVLEKIKDTSKTQLAGDLIKEHPTYGYLIIRNSKDTSPVVSQIILQHHENQDGSGYPLGLIGQNFPPSLDVERKKRRHIMRFAEICSVANIYDNLIMDPLCEYKMTPSDAMKKMISDSGTLYNKFIVKALFNIIALYPIGVKVKLSDSSDNSINGFSGIVAEINKKNINRPKVILLTDRSDKQIKPIKIDTSEFKHIRMEICL